MKRAAVDEARERRRCGLAIAKIDEIDENVHRDALLVEGEYEDVIGRKVVTRFIASQPLKIRAIYCGLYRRGLSQRELAFRLRITQPRVAQMHEELLRRGRAWFARAVASKVVLDPVAGASPARHWGCPTGRAGLPT